MHDAGGGRGEDRVGSRGGAATHATMKLGLSKLWRCMCCSSSTMASHTTTMTASVAQAAATRHDMHSSLRSGAGGWRASRSSIRNRSLTVSALRMMASTEEERTPEKRALPCELCVERESWRGGRSNSIEMLRFPSSPSTWRPDILSRDLSCHTVAPRAPADRTQMGMT